MQRGVVFGVLAALAVSGCGSARPPLDVHGYPLYSQAIRLLQDIRPFEYRLNGSGRHTSCLATGDSLAPIPRIACTSALDDATLHAAARLAARARSELEASGSADAMWTAALLDLVLSNPRSDNLDRALTRLNEVIARDTANGAARNDVTIAYARRAELRGAPGDLFLSLEAAQRALEAGTPSAAILFNLGLALEHVSFVGEATKAYHRALDRDSGTGWEQEARRRSLRLESMSSAASSRDRLQRGAAGAGPDDSVGALARADAEGVRLFVTDDLLPRWGELLAAGKGDEADSLLGRARGIARLLAAATGDSSTLMAVQAVAQAGATRRGVAAALQSFGEGSGRFRTADYTRAGASLGNAVRGFDGLREAGSLSPALTEWARLLLASTRIYAGDYEGAAKLHRVTLARLHGGEYPALRGRAYWGVAIGAIRQNSIAIATRSLVAAADDFVVARESSSLGAVQGLLVDTYYLAGQDAPALEYGLRGQRALRFHRHSPYLHNSLVSLGIVLNEFGLPVAANFALREAATVSVYTGRPKDPGEAFARLGRSEALMGRFEEAARFIRSAELAMSEVADPLARARTEADIAVAKGEVLLQRSPRLALEALDHVVGYYEAMAFPANLAPAVTNRARARLLLADTALAQTDLERALHLVEQASRTSADPITEASLRATRGNLFDLLIGIAIARGDTNGAFGLSERARRPAVRGRLAVAASASGPVGPPTRVVLAYRVLEQATALWIITPPHKRLVMLPIGRQELERRITRFSRQVRHAGDLRPLDELSGQLYRDLLEPAAGALLGAEELWIVPDGSLHQLPFALLRLEPDAPFVIERHRIRYLGSTTMLPDRSVRVPALRLLAVDGSGFDRSANALPLLASANREASAVAALYSGSALLEGSHAAKQALLDQLPRVDVLHFAGHARSLRGSADRSFLLLAGRANGSGEHQLTGRELARLDLGHLRLVVLSSCGSDALGNDSPGEENGIAQAFLSGGAAAVVSSLWEAEDEGAAAFMEDFHGQTSHGVEVAEALRVAQLGMLRRSPSPYSHARIWGAFRLEHGQPLPLESNH